MLRPPSLAAEASGGIARLPLAVSASPLLGRNWHSAFHAKKGRLQEAANVACKAAAPRPPVGARSLERESSFCGGWLAKYL